MSQTSSKRWPIEFRRRRKNRMNTRLTGIFSEGDTREFKEWMEKQFGSERLAEISDLKTEVALLRQTVERMEKKIDNISDILERVAD